ncbi:MAG TPA: ATP-binding protein [Candidatus Polarisedimenticolia bacterium]|nr:ATP-binding protein [Candidatus Polarisedimenticolia bacterium]
MPDDPVTEGSPPTGEGTPAGSSRVRTDRLILFSVGVLLVSFLGVSVLIRRASAFSWSYVTNSLVLSALFVTNAVLVLTLLILLMRNLIKALVERRRGILGSRFRTKLVFSLLLLWLVPSGIIFWAATQLIQRSIDRWFTEPADRLTEASQRIVDAYYDGARSRAAGFAREAARRLQADESQGSDRNDRLAGLLREYGLDLVSVIPAKGPPATVLDPRLPSAAALEDVPPDVLAGALAGRPFVWQSDFRGGHLIRAGHALAAAGGGRAPGVVVVGLYVSRDLARLAEAVTRSNDDYRQIRTQKHLIKQVYILVFALITLVVLFSVTWIGLYLARRITEPVQSLAVGTREIAAGNLDYRVDVQAGDELGILVDSFNAMTADLKSGKDLIERRNRELQETNLKLEERRGYIETLLQNLGAGVVSLDRDRRITTINRAARRLLGLPEGVEAIGRPLSEALDPEARKVLDPLIDEILGGVRFDTAREAEWTAEGRLLTLAVGATALRGRGGEAIGTLVLLEDLSDLMRAQKIAAWREVARRLAHEIKNPLTPIQLSAERIRKKVLEHDPDAAAAVADGTTAIVREVAALKRLVDEFARFARLPAPIRVPSDVRLVISEGLALYRDRHPDVAITTRVDGHLPQALLDPEQMKRVIVNLLDNAIEAMGGRGTVLVEAHGAPDALGLRLEIADDGPGIRPEDRESLFLPYFSTKKRGTGLGLAIVHRIVTDHMGRIRVEDNRPRGARFVIDLPAAPAAAPSRTG